MSKILNMMRDMDFDKIQHIDQLPKKPFIITELMELKQFIQPLTPEEKFNLFESIKTDGIRDPLILWKREEDHVIIDGHNRYEAIQKLGIKDYPWIEKDFQSLEEAKDWMILNQFSRRNLNAKQLKYYRGLLYNRMKKEKGGDYTSVSYGKNFPLAQRTSEQIAKEQGVTEKTIRNDGLYQAGLDQMELKEPGIKEAVLSGKKKISDAKIRKWAFGVPEENQKEKSKHAFLKKVEKAIQTLEQAKKEGILNSEQKDKINFLFA
ncbi:ParB N-terminal domain-containing protein [Persicobacter sp. CCB-QB2]|uniref:ParB/RepB/Spo0J family partition protein n=1 Tax=Persicobacter sp. CCB-QB2 TaxID=1561025 RepID=UPI0006A9F8C7|nr:ParB N-terminal domain-containing protein [Persicobacter sp. CCB-QB2]